MLGVLLPALALLALRARRWPVFLRLALRQPMRRPGQSALVVLGLALSSLLVAASLSTGDTIARSLRTAAVAELGALDEMVAYATPEAGPIAQGDNPFASATFFSADVARTIEQAAARDPVLRERVAVVAPAIWLTCSMVDLTTKQTIAASVRALPPDRGAAFGRLVDASGRPLELTALGRGDVYLNDAGARGLAAKVGDELTCTAGGVPMRWRVAAIAAPTGLGSGLLGGVFLPLEHMRADLGERATAGLPDGVNQVWIANRGGAVDSADHAAPVVEAVRAQLVEPSAVANLRALLSRPDLQAALAARRPTLSERTQSTLARVLTLVARGAPPAELEPALRSREVLQVLLRAASDVPDRELAPTLEAAMRRAIAFQVVPIKQQAIEAADAAGSVITTAFLLFALLSIGASQLLVFLIFSLLAASRRSEMGVARALGTERGHLVATFTFEGVAYALAAAAIGVPAGLLVSRALVAILVAAIESGFAGLTGGAERIVESIVWTVSPASLAIAAGLGLLLTVATVVWSSWRTARVTIVTAIRDLPDPPRRSRHPLSGWWLLLPPLGLALLVLGLVLGTALPFGLGVSGLLVALGRLLRGRVGATVAGLGLAAYWSLPFDAQTAVGLPRLSGGLEIFAVAGFGLIGGAAWAVAVNADLLEAVLRRLLLGAARPAPALRLAAAHALRRPLATGLTLAMFALVVFTLTVMQVMTTSTLDFFADPRTAYGGWQLQGASAIRPPAPTPAPAELVAAEAGRADLRPLVAGFGSYTSGFAAVLQPAAPSPAWGGYPVAAIDRGFAEGNQIALQARSAAYASDRDAWVSVAASGADAALAIADAGILPPPTGRGGGAAALAFGLLGARATGAFEPVSLWLGNPTGPGVVRVTVVGLIDRRTSAAFRAIHVSPPVLAALGPPARPLAVRYYARLQRDADVQAARAALGAAFFDQGLETTDLAERFLNQSGPLVLASRLLQAFVAIGLLVGIAALGVVAARAAIERRQEIGVLRAIGVDRGVIAAALLLESGLVVLLGSALGVGLGLLLCRNVFAVQLFDRLRAGMEMVVPYDQVALTVGLTCLAGLGATILPALRAAAVPPIAAIRGE